MLFSKDRQCNGRRGFVQGELQRVGQLAVSHPIGCKVAEFVDPLRQCLQDRTGQRTLVASGIFLTKLIADLLDTGQPVCRSQADSGFRRKCVAEEGLLDFMVGPWRGEVHLELEGFRGFRIAHTVHRVVAHLVLPLQEKQVNGGRVADKPGIVEGVEQLVHSGLEAELRLLRDQRESSTLPEISHAAASVMPGAAQAWLRDRCITINVDPKMLCHP